MNDKYYPKAQFDEDLEKIRGMNISHELKVEKGLALGNLYHRQEDEQMIDPFEIADIRETILEIK